MVLTGDTLFVGDVGRPDLAGAAGHSPEAMAGMLYDSLHQKLLRLPDAVEVYPAHGAGSLCGRNMSRETFSTIGDERRSNAALRPMARDDFVREMTTDLPEIPQYFSRDVAVNREGAPSISGRPLPPALIAEDVERRSVADEIILDVRSGPAFGAGHVPGSVNIDLHGEFAAWAGALIPAALPIVVVADDDEHLSEAVTRLARVGLDNVVGHLGGGPLAWEASGRRLARVPQMTVDELETRVRSDPGEARRCAAAGRVRFGARPRSRPLAPGPTGGRDRQARLHPPPGGRVWKRVPVEHGDESSPTARVRQAPQCDRRAPRRG